MRTLLLGGCGIPRRSPAVVVLVMSLSAGTAVALAQNPPDWNAKCGELDCRVERVRAAWQLVGVSRDLRTLKLLYASGGCRRGDGRATEEEDRIRVGVDEGEVVAIDTPDREVVCPSILRYRLLHVRLQEPVAGRAIEGGPRIEDPVRFGGGVPRVLDISVRDARTLLVDQGFRVHPTWSRFGRVIAQSPRPGRRAPRGDSSDQNREAPAAAPHPASDHPP